MNILVVTSGDSVPTNPFCTFRRDRCVVLVLSNG
jgi:hypothetical protein